MAGGNGAAAEEQYVNAMTSVFWDTESCPVPETCDPLTISQNIKSALVNMNYCGPVSISAYGDMTKIPPAVQQALDSTGIALIHVPGVKDASDKKLLEDMLFWALENPAPANILLISGDVVFANAVHELRIRNYNILLAQPADEVLVSAACTIWLWTSLLSGGSPLTHMGRELVTEQPEDQTLDNGHGC